MTTAWAARPERRMRAIVVRGHATGSEKVCAAVSGILYALAGYLQNAKGVTIDQMRMDDAYVCIKWTGGKRDLAALQMACIGLMQIEKAEGDFLKTEISEKIFKN